MTTPGSDKIRFNRQSSRFLEHAGFSGFPDATRESLFELYRSFTDIPYENVSKIISAGSVNTGHSLRSPADILEGYLESRLGGTCFSLTNCLYEILRYCGFKCYRVLGDMRHGPDIHCAVIAQPIDSSSTFLCDAGYLLPEPLEMLSEGTCVTRGTIYEYHLESLDNATRYALYTLAASGGLHWRYTIKNNPVDDKTFSFHWESSFSAPMNRNLVLTRNDSHGQIYLHKDNLRLNYSGGKKNVNIKNRIPVAVSEYFGIDPDLVEKAIEILEVRNGPGKNS